MKNEKENWFIEKLKDNSLALIFWSITVVFAGFNIYLTSQLAPIIQNIDILTQRVDASEKTLQENFRFIERFIQLESRFPEIQNDIQEIQKDIREIKDYFLSK